MGKDDSGVAVILIGAEIAQGHIRQIVFEIVFRLLYQCGTVSQKQDIRHILSTAQHICQAGCRSGFARTCCHYQQMLAKTLFDLSADGTNGFFLVIAVGDFIADGHCFQFQPFCPAVHEFLQVILLKMPLTCRFGLV